MIKIEPIDPKTVFNIWRFNKYPVKYELIRTETFDIKFSIPEQILKLDPALTALIITRDIGKKIEELMKQPEFCGFDAWVITTATTFNKITTVGVDMFRKVGTGYYETKQPSLKK